MSQLGAVQVEISVLLGRSKLPIHQFLRMGRGAVIPLDAAEHDQSNLIALLLQNLASAAIYNNYGFTFAVLW